MTSSHEYNTSTSERYPNSPYERLAAHVPYTIDTEPPFDGHAAKSAYPCAFVHAGPVTDPSKYGAGENGDTFAVINISYLPKRILIEEDGTRTVYRTYENTPILTDADLILLGPNFGEAHDRGWTPINADQPITVGREDEITRKLFPLSPEVSRNHFTLSYQDNRLSITDNGSSNGTHVWTAESFNTQPFDPLKQEYGDVLGDNTRKQIIQKFGELASKGLDEKALDRAVWKAFHPDVHRSEIPGDASADEAAEMEQKHHVAYLAAQRLVEQSGHQK